MNYEYKTVVVKLTLHGLARESADEDFFANVDKTLNNMASQKWEYVNNFSEFQNVGNKFLALVFRRSL